MIFTTQFRILASSQTGGYLRFLALNKYLNKITQLFATKSHRAAIQLNQVDRWNYAKSPFTFLYSSISEWKCATVKQHNWKSPLYFQFSYSFGLPGDEW